jgi:hypothetical protein
MWERVSDGDRPTTGTTGEQKKTPELAGSGVSTNFIAKRAKGFEF